MQRLRFGRKSPVSDWCSSTRIFSSARPSGRAFSFLEVLWLMVWMFPPSVGSLWQNRINHDQMET